MKTYGRRGCWGLCPVAGPRLLRPPKATKAGRVQALRRASHQRNQPMWVWMHLLTQTSSWAWSQDLTVPKVCTWARLFPCSVEGGWSSTATKEQEEESRTSGWWWLKSCGCLCKIWTICKGPAIPHASAVWPHGGKQLLKCGQAPPALDRSSCECIHEGGKMDAMGTWRVATEQCHCCAGHGQMTWTPWPSWVEARILKKQLAAWGFCCWDDSLMLHNWPDTFKVVHSAACACVSRAVWSLVLASLFYRYQTGRTSTQWCTDHFVIGTHHFGAI